MLRRAISTVDEQWQQRLEMGRRLTPAELSELIKVSAREIHGSYPFMTFLSY
jgi:hypothetical protein